MDAFFIGICDECLFKFGLAYVFQEPSIQTFCLVKEDVSVDLSINPSRVDPEVLHIDVAGHLGHLNLINDALAPSQKVNTLSQLDLQLTPANCCLVHPPI